MHVYASLAEFKNFLRENGDTSLGSNNDATMLSVLESASRRIDEWTGRGSGFGPRIGTNKYDGSGDNVLWLEDDLASTSPTVTIATATGASGTTATVDTDYFLQRGDGRYGDPPYRRILIHGTGSFRRFGVGYRVTSVTGTWGYPSTTRTLTATASAIADTTTTSVTVSAGAEFSPGQTLLIGTEQLYVRAVASTTLTVDRAVNGSTAATHGAAAAIGRYIYNASVVDACNRVALRRWRARDAGADGIDGGGQVGMIAPREGEDLILLRTVGHVRIERVW